MSSNYDTDKRSRAAKWGWRTRRAEVTPEILAHRRLDALIRTADPRLARLYVCDLADAALPIFAAVHPDTARPTAALDVARRYANGNATDKERLTAQHTLWPLYDLFDDKQPRHYTPPECALGAVSFALVKEHARGVEWGAYWAYIAVHGRDTRHAFHLELIAALEALAR
jgi:hypothetical protein